jgi:hypothetical protein
MMWRSLGALAAAATISDCASTVGGSSQVVSTRAIRGGGELAGAACRLGNNNSTWFVKIPGAFTTHRAYDDLSVKCEKDSVERGIATATSGTNDIQKPAKYAANGVSLLIVSKEHWASTLLLSNPG